jgi:hypothetical protein
VRLGRRFGIPRQIDAHERVWLTLGGVESRTKIWLNGQSLGEHGGAAAPLEFEITSLLKERNELVVEVEGSSAGGLWGEVALEIRCQAFLRNLRIWATRDTAGVMVHAAGEVAGSCEQLLDLYVIVGRSPVGYQPVRAGEPFEIAAGPLATASDAQPDSRLDVRVELVRGALPWHTIETSQSLEGV